MPNPKVNEADYYEAVGEWLVERGLGERWAPNVAKSTLWSVDVLGGKDGRATVACEIKRLAYPNGSAGAGAVGQAIALKVFVPQVYVVLIVGNRLGLKDCSWENPKKNQLSMSNVLGVEWPQPGRFEDYRRYLKRLFEMQFGATDLGLLVVNADKDDAVDELVEAKPGRPSLDQPSQWLSVFAKRGRT